MKALAEIQGRTDKLLDSMADRLTSFRLRNQNWVSVLKWSKSSSCIMWHVWFGWNANEMKYVKCLFTPLIKTNYGDCG